MKQAAAILLWISFGLLWVCAPAPEAGCADAARACERPAEIYSAREQAIGAMRQAMSLFEMPRQARVAWPERAQTPGRLAAAAFTAARPGYDAVITSSCYGVSAPRFPKSVRSADRYVYGLRKIII